MSKPAKKEKNKIMHTQHGPAAIDHVLHWPTSFRASQLFFLIECSVDTGKLLVVWISLVRYRATLQAFRRSTTLKERSEFQKNQSVDSLVALIWRAMGEVWYG
jgi:hypothetical protein